MTRLLRSRAFGRVLLLLVVFLALPASAQALGWSLQTSTLPGGIVSGTSCPTTTTCVQVQEGGKSQRTINGGATWILSPSNDLNLTYGLDCPSTTLCLATSRLDDIYRSTDLGVSWNRVLDGINNVYGIKCPSILICYAVGQHGKILKTVDGGDTWAEGASQTASDLFSVSCPTTTVCYSTGAAGDTYKKQAGSDTWDLVYAAAVARDIITPWTNGLSCPSVLVCFEAGTAGTITKTVDGGATWQQLTNDVRPDSYAMNCVSETRCIVVGVAQGSMLTTNGGATWSEPVTGSAAAMYSVTWLSPSVAIAGDATGKTYAFSAPNPPDATLAVSETLNPGTLSFIDSTPAGVTFPTRALTNADQTVTAAQPLVVADATGSAGGWSLAVTSTTFTTGSRTLSNNATRVLASPGIACKANATCTPATNSVSYPFLLPADSPAPTAQKLFGAMTGTGLGAQTITPIWSLTIPATAYIGTYTSTWTFTLTSGP